MNHKFRRPRVQRASCFCKFEKKMADNRRVRTRFSDRRRRGDEKR